jgi:hypothetical protein
MGDGPLADFLGRYVSWALEMYLQARSGLGGLYNPFAALRPFPGPLASEPPRPALTSPAEPSGEVAELRREVAALRKSLRRRKPRPPRRR